MSRLGNLGARLYRGEVGYDFIRNRKIWYGISILITITAIIGVAVGGLRMGIEFKGGAVFTTDTKAQISTAQATDVATEASGHLAIVQELGNGGLRIQITEVDTAKANEIKETLSDEPRYPGQRHQRGPGRPQLGRADREQGLDGPRGLHGPGGDLSGHRLRVADGRRRPHRADPRHHHHRRCLRPGRLRGHTGHGDRSADHSRILPVRHGGGLRQPQGGPEGHHQADPLHLQRDRQPVDQQHARPLHQHHRGGAVAGGRSAVHRRRRLRRGHAERHLAVALRRSRRLLRTPRSSSPRRSSPTSRNASRR